MPNPALNALVLGFPESQTLADRIAQAAGLPRRGISVHRFPDGESRLRLPPELPHTVFLVRSLDQPHDKLVELQLAADTARRLGARDLTLVAPYLCYMRQDSAFQPGEAVSQRVIADWLCRLVDRVVTVDPHLHRVSRLDQVFAGCECLGLSSASVIADHLLRCHPDAVLAGPDAESAQWVEAVASISGHPSILGEKLRHGDREVQVRYPEGLQLQGRPVVLIDDIASTGRTLGQAAASLLRRGAGEIHAVVVHGLFGGDALDYLEQAGVASVISTDSIPQPRAALSLAPVLGAVLAELADDLFLDGAALA